MPPWHDRSIRLIYFDAWLPVLVKALDRHSALLVQDGGRIRVPPAVAREVEPTVARLPDWVLVQELAHPLQPGTVSASIGPGEREVISLGLESGAALLILDEQPARRLATSLGLRVIGTVGILMAGKERGFLAKSGRSWTGCWQSGSSWIKISTIALIAQAGE